MKMNIYFKKNLILLTAILFISYQSLAKPPCSQQSTSNIEAIQKCTEKINEKIQEKLPNEVKKIFDGLDQLSNCQKKLWANEENINYPVLLTDPNGQIHWLRQTNGQIIALTSEDLATEGANAGGFYSKIKIKGEDTLLVSLSAIQMVTDHQPNPIKFAAGIDFIIHEGFHLMYQRSSKWKEKMIATTSSGSRFAIDWPVTCSPEGTMAARFLRSEILNSLLKANNAKSKDEQNQHLSTARYWLDKYNKEHPQESQELGNSYDRSEGTAELVGKIANLIIRNPKLCQASDSEFIKALGEDVNPDHHSLEFKTKGADESYAIGRLSGLLLMKKGVNWTNPVSNDQSPLDMLLKDQKPKTASISPQSIEKCNKSIAPIVQFFGSRVESILKDWNNPDLIAISLPNRSASSFSPGFVFAGTKQDLELYIGYTGQFGLKTRGEYRYSLKDQNLFMGDDACGKNRGILLVPKSALQGQYAKFQKTQEIKNKMTGQPSTQEITLDGAVTGSHTFLDKALYCLED